MRLVEVVHGERRPPRRSSSAPPSSCAPGARRRCGAPRRPGFIVNRVARPFYGEAQRMVEAGVADPATIDCALRELAGFRMGPLELTDLIGQDVNLAVGTSVWEQTGRDERYAPTDFQRRPGRRRAAWAARPAAASSRTTTAVAPRGSLPTRSWPRRLVGRAGRDQPGRPDAGHARQRGGRPRRTRGGERRGRRHRDAPGHQLPARAASSGARDRPGRRRRTSWPSSTRPTPAGATGPARR